MFKNWFRKKDKEKKVEEKIESKKSDFNDIKEEVIEESKAIKDEVVEDGKELLDKAKDEVNESKESLKEDKEFFNEKMDQAKEKFNEVKEEITDVNKEIKKEVKDEIEEVKEEINEIKEEKEVKKEKLSFMDRLKKGLSKSRDAFNSAFDNLINGKAKIDDDLYEELEELLISADIGVETTISTIDQLRDIIEEKHIRDPKYIKEELKDLLKDKLSVQNKDNDLIIEKDKPTVVLVIGVNGVGKTTTIGKLAHNIKKEGHSVMMAAADTFRAAAIEQLSEWADRTDTEIIKGAEGSDPASIVYDAIHAQKAKNTKVLLIDTAGRLHNKKNLMAELEKINRIIDREYPDANKEALLVLDATTGQNAVHQAKEFSKVTNITGIILTKLDGTAKGGVVFPLQIEHKVPVKFIGIGEQKDNLEKFDADKFVDALFG